MVRRWAPLVAAVSVVVVTALAVERVRGAAAGYGNRQLVVGLGLAIAFLLLWRFETLRRRTGVAQRARELERDADARLRALVDHASDTILTLDAHGRIQSANGTAERMLGRDASELVGSKLVDAVVDADLGAVATMFAEAVDQPRECTTADWRIVRPDGSELHVEAHATSLLELPAVRALVVTLRDVSERRAFEEQLRHRAFHDPLTQLPNRALFCDRVEHALARARRSSLSVAVLFIDLDDFKAVNDSFGHAAGDELLVGVSRRLRGGLRSADTTARLGGDEFAVLLEDVAGPQEVTRAAARMLELLRDPFMLHAEPTPVRASIGVAIAPEAGSTADELLRNADFAMYAAKHNGKACCELFDPAMQSEILERLGPGGDDEEPDRVTWFMRRDEQRHEIEELLAREDSITPVFQPIVDLRTGLSAGYEALARFPGPVRRPPNAWFAQAHQCGLGNELEALALRAALRADGRPEDTYLSVNLSQSALLAAETRAALPDDDLSHIVIEVTENELVAEGTRLQAALGRLRALGARVAVDDMGAGYAGLKQLMRLRPEMIKLDRALIDGVHADEAKAALIDSMVRYARRIGATVVAEGIETYDDLRVLADLDVTHGQGYGLARPAAPWAEVDRAAVETCRRSLREVMAHDAPADSGSGSGELRLELLMRRVSRASWMSDIGEVMEALASELHCDEVALASLNDDGRAIETVARHGWWPVGERFVLAEFPAMETAITEGIALQVLSSDAATGPTAARLMASRGVGSALLVPVTHAGQSNGLLAGFSFEERPWTRTEIHRARIVSYQLGTVLDSFTRDGDHTMRGLVHRNGFSATGIDEFRRRRHGGGHRPAPESRSA